MPYRFRLFVAACACAWLALILLAFTQYGKLSERIDFDQAFSCFAEVSYTQMALSWDERVAACSTASR